MNLSKLLFTLFFVTISTFSQQVEVNVNLNVKHKLGEVETFDRHKFVNFHSTANQNNWNQNNVMNDVIGDFLGDKDVHIGRNTGTISWHLKNNITEDPNRSGFANPSSITQFGASNRNNYAGKTWAHQYEYLDDQILCTQLHPFYPDGQTTNKGWAFSQTDTESEPFGTASGEFLGRYIQEFYGIGGTSGKPKPNFVEVTNEPLWDLVTTADVPHDLTKIFRFHSTVAKEVRKYNPEVKVGGYCAAFPDFDTDNFQRWHQRDKHFMDIAGADMDFWTIHLYDFPTFNGKAKYRKGSNLEATMDMLEQYSWMKFGVVKPTMISEYNAQTHDYNKQAWSGYRDWLKMKSTTSMMMQFMERANNINYAMPFFMLKAEWHYDASEGVTSVHGARMLRRQNEPQSYTGDFVYTDVIKLYDLLTDINGTRVDSYTTSQDIMVDAYVEDNKAYIMINNLDFVAHPLDLNINGAFTNATNIEVRQLYLNGTSDTSSAILAVNNYTGIPTDFKIEPEGTYVIVYTFPSDIIINEESEETKYYADSYLKPISANTANTFNFSNINLSTYGEAVLRLGVGRNHGLSLRPTITINGNEIAVPTNFRGDNQADRDNFFGVLEIPISKDILEENTTVNVTFPDSGGYISTATIQVFNFTSDIRNGVQIPVFEADYLEVFDIQTTLSSVTKGEPFSINFKYSTNKDIENMQATLYMHTSPPYTLATAAAPVDIPKIEVMGTEVNQSASATLNFTSDTTIDSNFGGTHSFTVLPSSELPSSEKYLLRFFRDRTNADRKFSTGSQFIFKDVIIEAIENENLSTENTEKKWSISPNPTSGIINIPDITNLKRIKVINILGQAIKELKAEYQIDISDIKAGIYFLLSDNGKSAKIIKK